MKIESPTLRSVDDTLFIESVIHYQGKKELLWFSIPEKYKQYRCC
jgi:hypothetical protein